MKKNVKITTAALSIAAVLASVCGAVFYLISIAKNFDRSVSHFNNVPYVSVFLWCFAAAAVLSVAAGAVTFKKASVINTGSYHVAVIAVYVLAGAMILASGFIGLKQIAPVISEAKAEAAKKVPQASWFTKEVLTAVATPILAIFSAAYFALISGKKKTESVRAFLGIAAIAWALFTTLAVYFRDGEPINSATKSIALVIAILDMLFITEDMRFTFGSQTVVPYRIIALLCVCGTVVFAAPNLFISVMKQFGHATRAPEIDFFSSLVSVGIGLCAAVRLITFGSCLGEYVPPKHEKKKRKKADDSSEKPASDDTAKKPNEAGPAEKAGEANEDGADADTAELDGADGGNAGN